MEGLVCALDALVHLFRSHQRSALQQKLGLKVSLFPAVVCPPLADTFWRTLIMFLAKLAHVKRYLYARAMEPSHIRKI